MLECSLVPGQCADDPGVRLTGTDAVAALIVLADGSYLLQHRDDKPTIWYPDHWGCFGGSIDRSSVDALVSLKNRPPGKPFLVLVAGSEMIDRLGLNLSRAAGLLAARFWPGPLTLVLAGGERRVPAALRGPEGGVAVRWTPHPALQQLIRAMNDPLTSTSANRPGLPPARSGTEILSAWSDDIARGRLQLLDGGEIAASSPSTVVDCTSRHARVIRPGAITAAALRAAVPDLIGDL